MRKSAVSVRRKKMQCLYEIFSVIEDYRRKIHSPGDSGGRSLKEEEKRVKFWSHEAGEVSMKAMDLRVGLSSCYF